MVGVEGRDGCSVFVVEGWLGGEAFGFEFDGFGED